MSVVETVSTEETTTETTAPVVDESLTTNPTPTTTESTPPVDPVEAGKEAARATRDRLWNMEDGPLKEFWSSMGKEMRGTIVGVLNHGLAKAHKDKMQVIFDNTPDGELEHITKLFEVRFNVSVGQSKSRNMTGKDWDAKGLRRCWEILKDLPPKHVEGNAWLEHWTRYEGGGSGGGYYSEYYKESSMGYSTDEMDGKNKAADPGDPLYDVIRFNKVVRHEVGHAVHKTLSTADSFLASDKGGSWKEHGRADDTLIREMAEAAGSHLKGWDVKEEKDAMIDAVTKKLKAGKPMDAWAAVKALPFWDTRYSGLLGGAKKLAAQTQLGMDPFFSAVEKNGPGKNPWYTHSSGGVALGGRIYQESYTDNWTSYDVGSRTRKVSQYQFRAPGEWFAEAYATYYEPDGNGDIGTLLNSTDANTKKWFDKNVHGK